MAVGPDKQFWGERHDGIGASEAAAVMGLSQYRTPHDVWEQKVNRTTFKADESMQWGTRLEEIILMHYVDAHPAQEGIRRYTYPAAALGIQGTVLFATPDMVCCELDNGVYWFIPIEAKNVSSHMRGQWGPQGSDQVPTEYLIQVQMQMYALAMNGLRCREARFAVLFGGNHYEEFRVPFDMGMAAKIAGYCNAFYWDYVVRKIEPPIGVIMEDVKAIVGKVCIASDDVIDAIERIKIAKSDREQSEKEIEVLTTAVKGFMEDSEILATKSGKVLATFKNSVGRKTFNREEFERVNPSITIDQFYEAGKPGRRLEIKD